MFTGAGLKACVVCEIPLFWSDLNECRCPCTTGVVCEPLMLCLEHPLAVVFHPHWSKAVV